MSEFYQSLSHSKWDCKYHVVFVPKYSGSYSREVHSNP
jgi:REP element-mobilizing transposase RayT